MLTAYDYLKQKEARHFTLDEWDYEPTGITPDILKYVDYRVIEGLDELRERTGIALFPSKLTGGWARFDGSKRSRHYAGGTTLATACDFFPAYDVLDVWLAAIEMDCWGGFGLYLDTRKSELQPHAMMHLDLRSDRLFWVRNEVGDYNYSHTDPEKFWNSLARVRSK